MADPLLAAMLADAAALSAHPTASSATALFPPQVTPRTGGVINLTGTSTTSSKLFPVVKISCSDKRVCFGRIGAGSAFCIRQDCSIRAHGDTKIPFYGTAMDFVFICQVVGSSAFVEPAVSETQIPVDVWIEWETKLLSLNEWRREFQAVVSTDDKFATFEDIKREANFLDIADAFRTPGKRKREVPSDDPRVETPNVRSFKYERVLPEEKEELDKITSLGGMKKGVLTAVVSGLETNLIQMNEGVEELSFLTTKRFNTNEETMNLMAGVTHNIRASLGSPVELANMFVAPTMWGTLSFMADEVTRIGLLLQDLSDTFNPFQSTTVSMLSESKVNGETLMKVVSMLMSSVKTLTSDNHTVKTTVADICQRMAKGQGVSFEKSTKSGRSEETVDDLMHMMLSNSIKAEGGSDEDKIPVPEGSGTRVDSMSHPILSSEVYPKFLKLIEDVGVLKLSAETSNVKFGNLGLRNLQECSRWVATNYSDARYGLIIDPLTLLDRIFGDDEVDPMTQLKTLESRLKLNIETGAESSSITSLGHSRPRIFHAGRPTMTCDQKTSRLNKLGKPSHWKTGGEGVRNYIIKQMNVLQSSIGSDIMFAFGNQPEHNRAQMIATLSLTASVAFLTQLMNYVDALFEKLHIYSKFTVETAWSLSMQVLDRIMSDLYVPKEGVGNGMKGDRSSICSHVLWASFRTLDVAQEYLDFNFENHPAISSEFIKFLATNSGFEKVEKLDATVTTVQASLATAVSDARNASSKSDTASTKCNELSGLVTALTRRVKALEDRAGR
jgi:hypothetical protein